MGKNKMRPPSTRKVFGTPTRVLADGTWIEPECGGRRRAFVRLPDGSLRTVNAAGVSDTYFSISARVTIKGRSIVGFVTGNEKDGPENGLEFCVMDSHKALFAALTGYQFPVKAAA